MLVNPGVPLATKQVFAAFDRRKADSPPARSKPDEAAIPRNQADLIEYLSKRGNDLEPAAISLQPEIANVLRELRASPGCVLARMSGSGATCFGIYQSVAAAELASRALSGRSPRWVHATMLGTN